MCLSFRPEGGEWLDVEQVEIEKFRQTLDLRRGLFVRELEFSDSM
ncbi:MAG: hypothetical protein JSV80_02100 [Acidobacteriota bacterium]|nr:MAG: hypothetical protein JSV80_02100 [Acidobacteriota bacterium]